MPDSFEFTIAKPKVELGADRTGSVVVDVTSRLESHGLVRVEVKPGEAADPSWFGEPDPVEFDLASGETLRTEIPISVPTDAPAGDHTLELRASSVAHPQEEFTNSPSISLTIPEAATPAGIPSWIFIVIAALVAIVAAFAVYYLFFRPDEEDFAAAPNVIALTPAEAQERLDESQTLTQRSELDDVSAGCVVLQTPPPDTPTLNISVLVAPCPTPAPNVVAPEVLDGLCEKVDDFCVDLEAFFGDDFADKPEWIEARTSMTDDFVEAFRTDGVIVESVIGMTEDDAIDALEGQGFLASPSADGSGGAQCVLLQHPFADTAAESGAEIRLVTTRCPAAADTADAVVLSTTFDVDGFTDLCDAALAFCNSIRSSDLGPAYFDSDDFDVRMAGMVLNFRNAFTGDTVPNVTTLSLGDAVSALEAKGLTAAYALPPSTSPYLMCHSVEGQNPAAGTLISTLPNDVVGLQLVESFCWIYTDFDVKAHLIDQDAFSRDFGS